MSPMLFLQRPARWLRAISRYRATTSGGPNFAYDLCVDATTPEEREGLDLSSWTLAFNGAERVRPETLKRFAETFEPFGFRADAFYPCYGLAEATLIVTGGRKSAPVVIRNRPDLEPAAGQGHAKRFFRTGDLGFVLDGELFVVSRLKDLIIVRGRNLYPEDIEATVAASHPLLRYGSCAVVPIEREGEEQVGVVIEVANRRAVDFDEVVVAINRQMVLEHEVAPHHVTFIRQNTLPRTSSGKVQRHLCRLGLERGTLDVVAERGNGAAPSS